MKKAFRFLAFVLAMVTLALSFTGCGKKDDEKDSDYYRAQNGLTWEGDHVSLDSVIGEYTEDAYEGISSGKYPSGMEDIIKDYFKNLND